MKYFQSNSEVEMIEKYNMELGNIEYIKEKIKEYK